MPNTNTHVTISRKHEVFITIPNDSQSMILFCSAFQNPNHVGTKNLAKLSPIPRLFVYMYITRTGVVIMRGL